MAERIVKLMVMGIPTYEGHMNPDDRIEIEESDSLVTINIRNSTYLALPVDPGADVPAEGTLAAEAVLVQAEDVSVEELKGLLRDKDLPVSGTKSELIKRINA